MNKNLLSEIRRGRELMNLISEAAIPYKSLIDDELKIFLKNWSSKYFTKAETKNIIQQLRNPATLTDNQVEAMIIKLAKKDKTFKDIIVKKIMQTTPIQSRLQSAITTIPNHKAQGTSIEDLYKIIDTYFDNLFPQGTFPGLKEAMVRQAKRFAYDTYNPTWSSAETILKHQADLFGQGFYKGRYAKSGGLLAAKQFGKGVLWGASFGNSPNWFPRLYKNLNASDRKILGRWMFWGVPDVPLLTKTWKELGGVAAGGVLLRQLLSKFIFVSLFVTLAKMTRDFIQDNMSPEEEYSDWGEGWWANFCIFLHRLNRAVDWPSFGVTSPAAWIASLVGNVLGGGWKGGGEALKKRVYDYILGENEENVPKLPPEWASWFKTNTEKIKQNTENVIKKGDQLKDTLLSGQDVNIKELVPDGSVRKEQDTTTQTQTNQETENTNSPIIKGLFFNYLKDSTTFKNIGRNDIKYIKDIGNNQFTYEGKLNIYTYKFDPTTKTFTQIKKEPNPNK